LLLPFFLGQQESFADIDYTANRTDIELKFWDDLTPQNYSLLWIDGPVYKKPELNTFF